MKHLDDRTFDPTLAASPRAVLVDFTAPWCPPCDALKPTLQAIANDRTDVDIVTLDVDESPEVAARFGVRAMPTLILFRAGTPRAQLVGNQSRQKLATWLDEQLR